MGETKLLVCDRCGYQEIADQLKEHWAWFHFEEMTSFINVETGEKSKPQFEKGKKLLCPDCTRTIGNYLTEVKKAK